MAHRFRRLRMLAPAAFLGCVLFAGDGPQCAGAPDANGPPDTGAAVDELISAFRNASALNRVQMLELLDASVVLDNAMGEPLFREALHDRDYLVGEAALQALTHRDNERNRVLSEADVAGFEGEAADLARLHSAEMSGDTAGLRELMQTGDAAVQEGAFNALAANDATAAIDFLRAEFNDRWSLRRLQSLELFVRSGYTNSPQTLAPILQTAAQDEDPLVRDYARSVLEGKPEPDSTDGGPRPEPPGCALTSRRYEFQAHPARLA